MFTGLNCEHCNNCWTVISPTPSFRVFFSPKVEPREPAGVEACSETNVKYFNLLAFYQDHEATDWTGWAWMEGKAARDSRRPSVRPAATQGETDQHWDGTGTGRQGCTGGRYATTLWDSVKLNSLFFSPPIQKNSFIMIITLLNELWWNSCGFLKKKKNNHQKPLTYEMKRQLSLRIDV